jgi:hypothetical protein
MTQEKAAGGLRPSNTGIRRSCFAGGILRLNLSKSKYAL